MSVAVGVRSAGGVWIGVDSYMSNLIEGQCVAGKAFMVGQIGFAVVGNFRHGQALEHHLDIAPPPQSESPVRWAVKQLVPALRDLAEEHELFSGEDDTGFSMLVAVRGEPMTLQSDWAVFAGLEGYCAVGTGSTVALGALHATSRWGARRRVEAAVLAACHHVPNVAAPVHTMWVPA